jgi:hypothetical protein
MVAPLVAALLGLGGGLTASKLFSSPEQAPVQPGLVPFDNGQGDGGVVGNISPNLNVPTAPASVNPTAQDVNALGPVNTAAHPGYAGIEGDLLPPTDLYGNPIAPFDVSKVSPASAAPAPIAPSSTGDLTLNDKRTPLGSDLHQNLANAEEFPVSFDAALRGKGDVLRAQSVKEGQEAYANADEGKGIVNTTQNAFEAPGGLKEVLVKVLEATGINANSVETARQAGGTVLKEAFAPSRPPHVLGYPIDMPTPSPSPVPSLTEAIPQATPRQGRELSAQLPSPEIGLPNPQPTPQAQPETAVPTLTPAPTPFDQGQTDDQVQTQGIEQQMKDIVLKATSGDPAAREDIQAIMRAVEQGLDDPTLVAMANAIKLLMPNYAQMGKTF